MKVQSAIVLTGLALGALAWGGCGSSPVPLSQQVSTWSTNTDYDSDLATVQRDLDNVGGIGDVAGATLRTVCDALVTDALEANQQLPAPDATLTNLLSTAYSQAATAGRECYDAANGDRTQWATSVHERSLAVAAIIRAQARYDAVTSSLPVGGGS